MLKCLCPKSNCAALMLALVFAWTDLARCESQSQSSTTPNSAPASAVADNRAAESRAVAVAIAESKTVATPPVLPAPAPALALAAPLTLVLREGDTVHIVFPGAHSLDNLQTIRRDGKITLEMVGEIKAAGSTAPELEQQILKAYGDQLVVKEVSVTVQMSVFKIFVTGAVLKPGPIISERVMTPLEAVIEAGIDHEKANLKKVSVVREHDDGKTETFPLNLDAVIKGKHIKPFTLQSMDKIYVPEKFSIF
jgi:polysaccharide export outer membrane protein